jgi:hypothetical protein
MRHQAAAERSASSRALVVALENWPQRRENQVPIRSAVASSSNTATGVLAPSSDTSARSAVP